MFRLRCLMTVYLALAAMYAAPPEVALEARQFTSCSAGRGLGCFSNCDSNNWSYFPDQWCQADCCSNANFSAGVDASCFANAGACPNPTWPYEVTARVSCLGSCSAGGCGSLGQSCTSGTDCCSGICNNDIGVCDNGSPILVKLDRGLRYDLTSPADGVDFDITGRGVMHQMAWTSAESLIAFLALDRNGNGTIDDGSELFGDATWLSVGRRARHGFEALLDLDGGSAASDGQINARDAIYPSLRLWLDTNHNGVSEETELLTLEAAGVTVIFTDYRESKHVDRHGNAFRYLGAALIQRGRAVRLASMVDVFFKVSL